MKKYKCPQCGTKLEPDFNQKVVCPVCDWGKPDGVDVRRFKSGFLGYIASKSLKWRLAAAGGTIAAIIILPTIIMIPVNQVRANMAINKAREQMDSRLYASAAKTLHKTPGRLISDDKTNEIKDLLVDNVRWARSSVNVKTAKSDMSKKDPFSALDDLANIEEDFPLDEEVVDLVDAAQLEIVDPDFELSLEELEDIAYLPNDPSLPDIKNIAVDVDVDIDEEALKEVEEIENVDELADDEDIANVEEELEESITIDEEDLNIDEGDLSLPDIGGNAGNASRDKTPSRKTPKPNLASFYYLKHSRTGGHFYSMALNNEVRPGVDKISGHKGYEERWSVGKISKTRPNGLKNRIVPLYRYWSLRDRDHYYTTHSNFAAGNKRANYQKQLIAGHVGRWLNSSRKCAAGEKPLFNLYSKSKKKSFLTTNASTRESFIDNGYRGAGIVGCLWEK